MVKYLVLLAALSLALSGCGRNMYDQEGKYETYETSDLFADGTSARPLIEGTVTRTRGDVNDAFFTGQAADGSFISESPIPVTEETLARGQERYNIYCSPCHNYNGNGMGMIVQKGLYQPASFHETRLQQQPIGYYFWAITNGFGAGASPLADSPNMYSYASRIPPEDRWAISNYIKVMQYSQYADPANLPEGVRGQLERAGQQASQQNLQAAQEGSQE